MTERTTKTTRRRLLKGAAATGVLYGGVGTASAVEIDGVIGTASDATGEATEQTVYPPEIEEIVSPLALNPTIATGRETLRIELDASVAVDDPSVTISPTFGSVRSVSDLAVESVDAATSELWIDDGERSVTVVEARLPPVAETVGVGRAPTVTPGLYDVTVSWDGGEDTQPRSLALRTAYPTAPTVYVVSDAHAGDPRAMSDAIERSADEGSPEPLLFRYENVVGVGTDTERWGAFRRAVAEVSVLDPDLVIFPGDLAFGQDVPKKFYQEYADAYEMLSALRAPVFTALGNHDGYVQGTTDGKELYRNYVGPWYYTRELWDGFRLTCIDTYDWNRLDRLGVSYGVSAWGGQVRSEQLDRLRSRLVEWREDDPDGTHVAFGHHSPAWRQDEGNDLDSAFEDAPVAEQVGRGVGDVATGGTGAQAWRGEGRLETRDLLSEVDTLAYFGGHAHRDRLSRVVGEDIVYTPVGDPDLARYDRDDELVDADQDALEAELVGGDGTLYVEATTAASGTSQYWGWRPVSIDTSAESLDPRTLGYPADEAFIEDAALDPDSWPVEHAPLGRYSHPSFALDAERLDTDGDTAGVCVRNDLKSPQSGTLLLSVPDAAGVDVDGGELVWRRRGEDTQDVTVAYDVDAESDHEIRVIPR